MLSNRNQLIASVAFVLLLCNNANALPGADVLSLVGGSVMKAPAAISPLFEKVAASNPAKLITFTMAVNSADVAGLEAKMLSISNSQTNPNGGAAWLTEPELAKYATPTPQSLDAVRSFLTAAGITADQISFSKFKDRVTVSGLTVDRASKLFGANFSDYTFQGKQIGPRTAAYTIPSSLKGVVSSVSPFTVFMNVRSMVTNVRPIISEDALGTVSAAKAQGASKYMPAGAHVSSLGSGVARRQHRKRITTDSQVSKPIVANGIGSSNSNHGLCDGSAVTPDCLRTLYKSKDYAPKANQTGEDVAVMGYIDQSVSQADLTAFLQQYRPDAANMLLPIRSSHEAINLEQNPGLEAMLDVETVVSQIWPLKAAFQDVGTYLTQGDVFQIATQDFIDKFDSSNRPRVVTTSYGADEPSMTAEQAQLLCDSSMKLTALGSTLVYSSGDNGVSGTQGPPEGTDQCPPKFTPTYPSGCPYVLSVGALSGFQPESAVGQGNGGFYGGAGFSTIFPTPAWQKDAVAAYFAQNPNEGRRGGNLDRLIQGDEPLYNHEGRAYPDVSAQGVNYAIVSGGSKQTVSGTSASGPTVASQLALINDARRRKGLGSIGWIHPLLYKTKGQGWSDVTLGGSYGCSVLNTQQLDPSLERNKRQTSEAKGGEDDSFFEYGVSDDLQSIGFSAAKGWDPSTGWGSPDFHKLSALFKA